MVTPAASNLDLMPEAPGSSEARKKKLLPGKRREELKG